MVAEHFAVLDDAERAACQRLRSETHRARYAAGHALLRRALAETLNIEPAAIALQAGKNRRPEMAPVHADIAPGLDFNLSSTSGFVAVAIGHRVRVGIDLERVAEKLADAAIFPTVLSADEQEWVRRSSDPQAFFRIWTLKEALAKADGEGLGLPFNRIQTLPRQDGGLDLDLSPVRRPGANWRIFSLQASVPAALAIAGADVSGPVVFNDTTPPGFEAVGVEIRAEGHSA